MKYAAADPYDTARCASPRFAARKDRRRRPGQPSSSTLLIVRQSGFSFDDDRLHIDGKSQRASGRLATAHPTATRSIEAAVS